MAKVNKIYIVRDDEVLFENFEESQSEWMDEHHPDKTVIACEESTQILVNEEDTAMMCMEYFDE